MTNLPNGTSAPGFDRHSDYLLDIVPSQSLHQFIYNEAIIAASRDALIVREQDLRDVLYVPRADIIVPITLIEGQSSYCPFKGTASYWNFEANGSICERAAWSYDDPYNEVASIDGYIAFYLNKMDCYWRNGIEQPLLGPGGMNRQYYSALVAA